VLVRFTNVARVRNFMTHFWPPAVYFYRQCEHCDHYKDMDKSLPHYSKMLESLQWGDPT